MKYKKKFKSKHGIGLPTTCGYQNYGEKKVFYVRAMFDQYYFVLRVLHNILQFFLYGDFSIFPVFLYWKKIYYVLQALTMINISV